MTSKHHRIAIVSVNRSPSVPFTVLISELRSVLLLLSASISYIMMAGDFNVNLLVSGGATQVYLDLLKDPTRVCGVSETLIYHIFGTGCFNVSNVTQALGVSDYRM